MYNKCNTAKVSLTWTHFCCSLKLIAIKGSLWQSIFTKWRAELWRTELCSSSSADEHWIHSVIAPFHKSYNSILAFTGILRSNNAFFTPQNADFISASPLISSIENRHLIFITWSVLSNRAQLNPDLFKFLD